MISHLHSAYASLCTIFLKLNLKIEFLKFFLPNFHGCINGKTIKNVDILPYTLMLMLQFIFFEYHYTVILYLHKINT